MGKSFWIVLRPLPQRDAALGPGDKSSRAIAETIAAVEGELREVATRAARRDRSAEKANRCVGTEPARRAGRREQGLVAVTADHGGPCGIRLYERQLSCAD